MVLQEKSFLIRQFLENPMSQIPENENHFNQIMAGINGRKRGHAYEKYLSDQINAIGCNFPIVDTNNCHLFLLSHPVYFLLSYICHNKGWKKTELADIKSHWLGGLATSNHGDILFDNQGNIVTKSKSDIVIEFYFRDKPKKYQVGVSVKSCFKDSPTNDQICFTTANAFCDLLTENRIEVSLEARRGLNKFCGDTGFRPIDLMSQNELTQRLADKERYYWEEIGEQSKQDWEMIFRKYQSKITKLLLQKSYPNDPFLPEILFHLAVKPTSFEKSTFAIYSIEELVQESTRFMGFSQKPYKIKKGRNKKDRSEHLAPFFGYIQFQRGGQKQHPTQLQFNLKASYFGSVK